MRPTRLLIAACLVATSLLTMTPLVGVAGADYGGGAALDQWQVGLSYNCNNPTPGYCVDNNGNPSLGGFWGWYVFTAPPGSVSGTGDAQLAGCGHTVGGGGPGSARAGHFGLDNIAWHRDSNGDFWIDDYTVKVTGKDGATLAAAQFPLFLGDSGVSTTPGHYGFHPAPGIVGEVTVSFRPGR
jgi:hypothetical protein